MAEQVKTKAVRTVPGGDIKPPWEVRELPAPPPKTFGSFMVWAGPADDAQPALGETQRPAIID